MVAVTIARLAVNLFLALVLGGIVFAVSPRARGAAREQPA
jgi:hypothetical protein